SSTLITIYTAKYCRSFEIGREIRRLAVGGSSSRQSSIRRRVTARFLRSQQRQPSIGRPRSTCTAPARRGRMAGALSRALQVAVCRLSSWSISSARGRRDEERTPDYIQLRG